MDFAVYKCTNVWNANLTCTNVQLEAIDIRNNTPSVWILNLCDTQVCATYAKVPKPLAVIILRSYHTRLCHHAVM